MGDKKTLTSAVLPATTSGTSPEQSDKAIAKLLKVLGLGYSVSEYRIMQAEQEKKRELTLRHIADIGSKKSKITHKKSTPKESKTPISHTADCNCNLDHCPFCSSIFDRRGMRKTTPLFRKHYKKEGVLWAEEILYDPLTIKHLPESQQQELREKARNVLGISPRHNPNLVNIEKKFYVRLSLSWDKTITRYMLFEDFIHGDPESRVKTYEVIEDLGCIARCKEHWADKLDDWRY